MSQHLTFGVGNALVSKEKADILVSEARKKLAVESGNTDLVFMELETEITGKEVVWEKIDR